MARSSALSCAGWRTLPRNTTSEPTSIIPHSAVSRTFRAVVMLAVSSRRQNLPYRFASGEARRSAHELRPPDRFCRPLVNRDLFEEMKLAERLAGAQNHA